MICPNCNSKLVKKIRKVYVTTEKVLTFLVHCENCDYLYLDNPNWLDIAYRNKFYGDTGYIKRNINLSNQTLILFRLWKLISRSKFPSACDIGAGIGFFAWIMRDNGYNFFGSDEYSDMVLIKPFIKDISKFPIKTAFEVVEHLPSLSTFLNNQIKEVDLFLFSTELREIGNIPNDDWWYYNYKIGQHIGFHSKKSLKKAFHIAGYNPDKLLSYGSSIHALANTNKWIIAFKVSRIVWKFIYFIEVMKSRIFSILFFEKSKLISDHYYAMDLLKKQNKN